MAAVLGPLRPEEERLFQGQPKGFPIEEFALEDVMLPENDDMGIPSEEDSDEEEEIETESGFGSVIVVDNLPEVPADKYDKLVNVLRSKVFGQVAIFREGGLWMPKDPETQVTLGFAFVEFATPEEARAVQQQVNKYRLDKSHSLAVTMFDDFEKYAKVSEEYEEPERKPYKPQENLQQWMMDRRGRDQFAVRFGDETEIGWNDAQRGITEQVYQRTFWTESFVQWSPHGSYLATLHMQGVAIWGGSSFSRIHRYSHSAVRLMNFSPNERYLITYSLTEPASPTDKATMNFNAFSVHSGRKLRNFTGTAEDFIAGAAGTGGVLNWPIFKWAGHAEDRYFARLAKNAISVYEAPEMGLLDRKSIKLDNVYDFQWSPAEPILCAFQTEQANGNLPARISLIRIPDRVELRQKNLFSVSEVKLYWHPQGSFLAVQVDRYTKTRKSTYTSFELFSVKERDIPMEVLELPSKTDKIVDFAWEPHGTRFAVLHGEGGRPSLSLYEMKDMRTSARGVQLVATQPNKQVNGIHWSPQGKFLLLAGLKSMQGQLEFFSADDFEVMSAAEHFMATDVMWDPTGRYVATSVTQQHEMENGFNVWQFNGQLLYRVPRDKFFQFSWRPRAPTRLSAAQQEEIQRNLKTTYSRRYEEEDAAVLQETDTQIVADRQRLLDEWQAWYAGKQEWLETIAAGRAKILDGAAEEGQYEITQAEVEELISSEETILKASNGY